MTIWRKMSGYFGLALLIVGTFLPHLFPSGNLLLLSVPSVLGFCLLIIHAIFCLKDMTGIRKLVNIIGLLSVGLALIIIFFSLATYPDFHQGQLKSLNKGSQTGR